MNVQDCINQIRFDTSTLDDLSGKSINTLFNNNSIAMKLNYALDIYARETRSLEGIYTQRLTTEVNVIDKPPLALRAMSYRYIQVYIQGVKYPMDITSMEVAQQDFIYQWKGIPRWIVPWQDKFLVFPISTYSGYETTLSVGINALDTTIELTDASGLLQFGGVIQIGDEKIFFTTRTGNVLSGCVRGYEDTIAVSHDAEDPAFENNLWIYYYKRHFPIVSVNNVIPNYILSKQMEIPDEHMETITAYTAASLLAKIDPMRNTLYEKNFRDQLIRIKAEVFRGRKMTNPGANIRPPFWSETAAPGIYFQ